MRSCGAHTLNQAAATETELSRCTERLHALQGAWSLPQSKAAPTKTEYLGLTATMLEKNKGWWHPRRGNKVKTFFFLLGPSCWKREEKYQDLEIFEFLLFRLNILFEKCDFYCGMFSVVTGLNYH